jgi:hypothetical protein
MSATTTCLCGNRKKTGELGLVGQLSPFEIGLTITYDHGQPRRPPLSWVVLGPGRETTRPNTTQLKPPHCFQLTWNLLDDTHPSHLELLKKLLLWWRKCFTLPEKYD